MDEIKFWAILTISLLGLSNFLMYIPIMIKLDNLDDRIYHVKNLILKQNEKHDKE